MQLDIPESDILYHYCSTKTFESIITSKKIRLSSLAQANDAKEGKVLRDELSCYLLQHGLSELKLLEFNKQLDALFSDFGVGFAFCLSRRRDSLSQWRGYADDAYGVAIGFSKKSLHRLAQEPQSPSEPSPALIEVKYNKLDQFHAETFSLIADHLKRGGLDYHGMGHGGGHQMGKDTSSDLVVSCLKLYYGLFHYKSASFEEEEEWRLLLQFTEKQNFKSEWRGYHPTRGRLVPFVNVDLKKLPDPIATVVLGPNHTTPIPVIERFLRDHNFHSTRVVPSNVTYRTQN